MGFTPLEGVMMGTRSGSIDLAIVSYVCRQTGETAEDITRTLNQLSGLKGVSDGDSDMRSVLDRASKGDKVAALAVEMFVYILAKHIAAMSVPVSTNGEEQRGIDAIVFSAGIGENSPIIRERTLKFLSPIFRFQLDHVLNSQNGKYSDGVISKTNSEVSDNTATVLVVATDEEAMICQECLSLVKK
jgi:acetate kinase